ncbi:MAG: exodeoxyribonuclease VII large subunit [Bacteroidetes bacterium]|nr:exodeoxyribonuclease VII large subunit [Bacteroidota bacterium]
MLDEFESQILSVSDLTNQIKLSIEKNFSRIAVIGEVSNFKAHVSGHWYFNLKDADAVINCTMWKGFNNYVSVKPQDGMKVIVNGRITVYPPRGNYQIDVRSMKPAGMGELQEAYEKLKQKLEELGLFDEEYKKPIPSFPQKIGIVTAIDGAAFRDMISVAERRYPLVELIIAPAIMQGGGAAESIVQSLKQLNKVKDIDVIIVSRGGGSIEDLWAFNEEIVAHAIYDSIIPVITGVGHEIDFTISDFVADLRAPTPSIAMELATPNMNEIFAFISEFAYNTTRLMKNMINDLSGKVHSIVNSYAFGYPKDLVRRRQQQIDFLISRILNDMEIKILTYKSKTSVFSKVLETYNIKKTLERGFVLVKQNSKYVISASEFESKKSAQLIFSDGNIKVRT